MPDCEGKTMKWDEIVSIKNLGEEHVYDLQIEDTHNFLGNDVVAHNTFISGNTGIGFSTPDRRLLISSDIDIVGSNASLLGTGGTQFSITGDSGSGTQKKLTIGIDTTDNFGVIQAGSVGTNYALSLSPAGGNVGIGTTSTNATLSVVGNASIGGLYTGVSPPTNGLFVNGNVGIGATTSTNILDVWGNQRITGNLTLDGTCTGCAGDPAGWTDDGTVVRLTTLTDNVGIGTTSPSQRLQINFSSSTPFVVTSGGNVGIGFTTPLSLLHVQGDGSTGTWATNSNSLPAAQNQHSSIVANGYVYVVGGGTGSVSTVYYARLNADGSLGTWTTNSNYLPGIRFNHSSIVANGYVYVIGGTTGTIQSTVLYAKLNSDGSTGSWTTNSNYLPGLRSAHSSIVANGYVYVIGGTTGTIQSTVLYAKLNSDGSTGSWTTNSN
ncbi:hypothetical protein HY388_00665, partial [Candidatus Daviesbacteria bacterium]|nr:hypothetical protein [Candidatus Daviesbacteria bacterium]